MNLDHDKQLIAAIMQTDLLTAMLHKSASNQKIGRHIKSKFWGTDLWSPNSKPAMPVKSDMMGSLFSCKHHWMIGFICNSCSQHQILFMAVLLQRAGKHRIEILSIHWCSQGCPSFRQSCQLVSVSTSTCGKSMSCNCSSPMNHLKICSEVGWSGPASKPLANRRI